MEHTHEREQTPSHRCPHDEGICERISTRQVCAEQRRLLGITSDVIFVGGVDFFYSSVAEGQLSHPVHASPHACGQTKIGAGRGCVETVSAKVVRTELETKKGSVSACCTAVRANQTPQFVLTIQPNSEGVPQILAVVVRGHIIDMHLVTFLEYKQRTHPRTLSNEGVTHCTCNRTEFRRGYLLGNYTLSMFQNIFH